MCSAGSRLLVQGAIHDDFVARFEAKVKNAFLIGDPLDPATMGPLVNRTQRQRALSYIDIGTKEGAVLAVGGGTPAGFDDGAYVEPTLFTKVTPAMTIAREEIFGPVAAVLPFGTIGEAIEIAPGAASSSRALGATSASKPC